MESLQHYLSLQSGLDGKLNQLRSNSLVVIVMVLCRERAGFENGDRYGGCINMTKHQCTFNEPSISYQYI